MGCLAAKPAYNILSLDSAIYKGVMQANFVQYMERKSYLIAREYECSDHKGKMIGDRVSQKVSMAEIFDMIAGSETGAILASTLILPNKDEKSVDYQPNAFFADKVIEFFKSN